jgi:hypothetical protein
MSAGLTQVSRFPQDSLKATALVVDCIEECFEVG